MKYDSFIRSINIHFDAEDPERISHYFPTAKCTSFLKALLSQESDSSYFIVAPYGSGKSLTALYLMNLVENHPRAYNILAEIEQKLIHINPDLAKFSEERRLSKERGLVIALHGYLTSVPEAFKHAIIESMRRIGLGREARTFEKYECETITDLLDVIDAARVLCLEKARDRLIIIWDEFGKHLDTLVSEGRTSSLIDIQTLAEFVSRSKNLPMTMGLLLHQGVLHYAGNMSQSARNEWTKIEGRFKTIQYVDDSKETYELIANVIASKKDEDHVPIEISKQIAEDCRSFGIFSDFPVEDLHALLTKAYPVSPVALYLLPRVSARVAQNERTLFSFLYETPLDAELLPSILYDYFSAQMRSDITVGGTHRRWLETESAISKIVDNPLAVAVLKTTCLLGLGLAGERARTGKELLLFALKGFNPKNDYTETLDELLQRKLLLYRKHNDEVSVWHGTDLDLRGRLEDEKNRHRTTFDLLGFLSKETKPPVWRPQEYNDNFGIRRFLIGEFHSVKSIISEADQDLFNVELPSEWLANDCDGKVIYLIPDNPEELGQAEIIAQKVTHCRVFVSIPSEHLPLFDTALDVYCLSLMHQDPELTSSDPIATSELEHMMDDARNHLQRILDRVVMPSANGPRWFFGANEIEISSASALRRELSHIMTEVYNKTPRLLNELIVRKKPSGVVVNARKKLIMGILERSGTENLGLQGNFPDSSMFRTILLHTGIYRKVDDGWKYAQPEELDQEQNPGLGAIWRMFRDFLTIPSSEPKSLSAFFNKLIAPPYGIRAGLLPILFAAGIKAFPSALSLMKDGEYIDDILPSEIEQLCKEPDSYQLVVLELNKERRDYLVAINDVFSSDSTALFVENDLIRKCYDSIKEWKRQLPVAAMSTKRLSSETLKFRAEISKDRDPVKFLLEDIPAVTGFKLNELDNAIAVVTKCKTELENVIVTFREQAKTAFKQTFALAVTSEASNLCKIAMDWSNCFSEQFIASLKDGTAQGFFSRMKISYESDLQLLESLASHLVLRLFTRWDDDTAQSFERELHNVVHRIEEYALLSQHKLAHKGAAAAGLAQLVERRIKELAEKMTELIGKEETHKQFTAIVNSLKK
jgi:hypothetical protein